jgi:hypothetical protein
MTDPLDTGAALRDLYAPRIFERFREDSMVKIRYRTTAHLGRPA